LNRRAARDLERILLALLFSVVLVLCLPWAGGRKDPETGRIRVLYVGDLIRPSPYPILEAEPFISVTPAWPVGESLTMDDAMVKKAFRQYIPRTYAFLAENDAIVIDNPEVTIFEDQHLMWFKRAVIEGGSGLVMIGGNAGFGGRPSPPWGPTVVQDILPVLCVTGGWLEPGRVEILKPQQELLSTLPLDRRWPWMGVAGGNEVKMKNGAELLAQYRGLTASWTNPYWATWDTGQGRCFAMTCDWSPLGGVLFMKWPYYADFAVNLMMYLSQNPIPRDLALLHQLRSLYVSYRSNKAYLYSVMDFAERVGANMAPANRIVLEADRKQADSVKRYVDYEFEDSLRLLESSLVDLRRASAKAFELKDEAMLWIFLIEWFVITATFALAGSLLWTIMVRRRLYREVVTTRLR